MRVIPIRGLPHEPAQLKANRSETARLGLVVRSATQRGELGVDDPKSASTSRCSTAHAEQARLDAAEDLERRRIHIEDLLHATALASDGGRKRREARVESRVNGPAARTPARAAGNQGSRQRVVGAAVPGDRCGP
jgi:hypothetical protein